MKNCRNSRPGRNRGLTLVEMMVAMAIGLVVTIAIVASYLGSSGAAQTAEAQSRMNEDGQAALSVLTQQLRMAGNNPKQIEYALTTQRNPIYSVANPPFAVRGCDGTFSNITTATSTTVLTCAGAGAPDSIAITYEADKYNTVPTSGSPTDCLGQTVPVLTGSVNKVSGGTLTSSVNVTYTVADNRFYIGTSTSVTSPSLFCKGNGGATAQPMVENIEAMQFTYGTAPTTATGTLTVAGYLNADGVTALTGPADDNERWKKVVTVRICVLVRSELPVAPNTNSAQYVQCDGSVNTAPPDLRLRRTYSTTVVLRNRVQPS